MDRFNALGRGTQIMLVAGVLLFIDLFLTWQDFDPGGVDIGDLGEFNGWEGFLGVLLGILTIALVAWIVLRLVAPQVQLPVSHTVASAVLGAAIVLIGVLKLISVIDDEATIFAFIGGILAVLVGVGAWMVIQSAGGIDTLKAELPSMQTTTSLEETPPASTPTPPPTTTPPAAPTETAPPPAEPAPPETAPEPRTEYDPDDPNRPRDV